MSRPGPYRIQPVIFQKPSLKERLAGTFSTVAAFVVTFYLFTTFSKAWAPLLSDHDRSDSHDHHSQRQQHDSEAGGDQQTNGGPDGAHSGISSIFGRADMAEGSAEEDEDLIDEEDVLFVPLTYPKLIPGEFYAGTDPEWLTFVHIARDRELLQQIKESLVQVAGNAATHNPTLAANLGDAVQLMSYWIMHDFPYRAPPEYVRSGIEVGPDYVGWVTRVVTNEEASKIKQMYSFDRIRASVWQAWKIAAANRLLRVSNATCVALTVTRGADNGNAEAMLAGCVSTP
ncbi:hypothetical protein KEM52_002318 [Ascosphaera acerosa]|nr:hypothetical protein KEM52_002318 [Ascosphaera acerosa]